METYFKVIKQPQITQIITTQGYIRLIGDYILHSEFKIWCVHKTIG